MDADDCECRMVGKNFHSSVVMPDGSIVLMGGIDGTLRMIRGGQPITVQRGNSRLRVPSGQHEDRHSSVVYAGWQHRADVRFFQRCMKMMSGDLRITVQHGNR